MNCRKCSHTPALQSIGNYPDGSLGMICGCCQADGGVLHRCSHDLFAVQPSWLPLLLAGIAIVCPKCKAAYDLGVKIAPVNPEAGETLKVVGILAGLIVLIGVAADILDGKKRRRR
jgi:hypothetical protein